MGLTDFGLAVSSAAVLPGLLKPIYTISPSKLLVKPIRLQVSIDGILKECYSIGDKLFRIFKRDMTASILMHRWRLNELMARYRIGTGELAEELGYLSQSVSKMRTRTDMPKLSGEALTRLCDALNKLIREKGETETVTPADLIEYSFRPESESD